MIYLLMQCSGEYYDYNEVPILASTDKEKIEQRIVELNIENDEHNRIMELLSKFRDEWIKENPRPDFKPVAMNALPETLENTKHNVRINDEFFVKKEKDETTFLESLGIQVGVGFLLHTYYTREYVYDIAEVETI